MSGKFEVYKDSVGKFGFRLRASNGEVVASGQGYSTKASAKRGCESVLKAADGAPVVVTANASESSGRWSPPSQRNGTSQSTDSTHVRTESENVTHTSADQTRRQFRFAGGISADPDLAAHSGAIIEEEFRRRS